MTERDVVLWNSMDSGYAQRGRYVEALEVFQLMEEERFLVMLGTIVFKSMLWDATPWIDMYGKCKSLKEASKSPIHQKLPYLLDNFLRAQ
ncbi:hypothetical protein EJ110_NYTH33748 [Nymphaea thermarum]|nr:hypothetical protein EJ110_NYTH33748 [Nymphaea thermarum]